MEIASEQSRKVTDWLDSTAAVRRLLNSLEVVYVCTEGQKLLVCRDRGKNKQVTN